MFPMVRMEVRREQLIPERGITWELRQQLGQEPKKEEQENRLCFPLSETAQLCELPKCTFSKC